MINCAPSQQRPKLISHVSLCLNTVVLQNRLGTNREVLHQICRHLRCLECASALGPQDQHDLYRASAIAMVVHLNSCASISNESTEVTVSVCVQAASALECRVLYSILIFSYRTTSAIYVLVHLRFSPACALLRFNVFLT
jgi:hypothetical protein